MFLYLTYYVSLVPSLADETVEVSPLKRSRLSVRKARDDMHRGLHVKFVWYRMGQM